MSQQKAKFLSQLQNSKNNLIIGLAAIPLICDPKNKDTLKASNCKTGGYTIEFSQVCSLIEEDESKDIAMREYILMLYRAAIKESFELVKTYCSETDQMETFEEFNCYPLMRQLRNAISHNFRWNLKNRKNEFYKELPISWSGIELRIDHHDQPVELDHIPFPKMLEIVLEMHQCSEDLLS